MVQKVNSKIVGYSIKKDSAVEQEKSPKKELMNEEIARPDELKGYTYKIKTPLSDHAMYITINNMVLNPGTEHEQEHPFEIFINSKNMEQFQWILALTRVISAVFRKGGDSAFLAEELKQVFDPQGGYFKKGGRFMPSLVAEIGEVLETHMKKIGLIKTEALTEEHKALIEEKRLANSPISTFDQLPVTKGKGRFGPFLKWNGLFINVNKKIQIGTFIQRRYSKTFSRSN